MHMSKKELTLKLAAPAVKDTKIKPGICGKVSGWMF